MDKSGKYLEKSRGRVVCYVELKIKESENFILKKDFKFGKLKISRIQTFNLKNTEIGLGALQDPYVVLKLGEGWTDKTYTQENGGSDVLWDFLTLGCDLSADMVKNQTLDVIVYDENTTRKDTEIGRGSCSLMKCGADIGVEKAITLNIVDEKGQPSGRVILYAVITDTADAEKKEAKVEVSSSFSGTLRVKRISLANTTVGEGFTLQKIIPFVILKYKKFNERTTNCTTKNEANAT